MKESFPYFYFPMMAADLGEFLGIITHTPSTAKMAPAQPSPAQPPGRRSRFGLTSLPNSHSHPRPDSVSYTRLHFHFHSRFQSHRQTYSTHTRTDTRQGSQLGGSSRCHHDAITMLPVSSDMSGRGIDPESPRDDQMCQIA